MKPHTFGIIAGLLIGGVIVGAGIALSWVMRHDAGWLYHFGVGLITMYSLDLAIAHAGWIESQLTELT